ncbi:MAG: GAF domain-containing protein [Prolixibacteraceae bacterium]|nr:GAF domain-containing protein [Prolixibacteraceae bacterium]MBN2649036.1 GAF domain-containing protein [Prolixibacteraceae bacterium]
MDSEKILSSIDGLLNQQKSVDETLQQICKTLHAEVSHYDWVGFYMLDKTQQILVLGQYVGKPTEHIEIEVGKGVCGQVAEKASTMIVQDVSKMDNYIACSLDVQSEIVVPILKNGKFVAEIDIDSHAFAPFTQRDEDLLETIASKISYLF